MPSFCIELVRRPTNAWQKSWREQAAQRPSRPQNQPNEERMRSTHPRKRQRLVVMHGTTATIRPRHALRNCSKHEIFITKINNFANLEFFTKFLCLENLELHVYGIGLLLLMQISELDVDTPLPSLCEMWAGS